MRGRVYNQDPKRGPLSEKCPLMEFETHLPCPGMEDDDVIQVGSGSSQGSGSTSVFGECRVSAGRSIWVFPD